MTRTRIRPAEKPVSKAEVRRFLQDAKDAIYFQIRGGDPEEFDVETERLNTDHRRVLAYITGLEKRVKELESGK